MTSTPPEPVHYDAPLEEYVRHISSIPVMDPGRARDLFRSAAEGNAGALDEVVAAHLRFVLDLAFKRRGLGASLEELIRAGNRGLERAVDRFDARREERFLPFALRWIREEMRSVLPET